MPLLRKPVGVATLGLFDGGAPVGAMPISDWTGEAVDKTQTQPNAWRLISVGFDKNVAAWAVDVALRDFRMLRLREPCPYNT